MGICLIVGGVLCGLSWLGGADHDLAGHGVSTDHPGAGNIASWFSLRALVSFAAFFGLAGVAGGLIGASVTVQFVMALAGGLAVGGFTAYLFRLARTRGEVSGGPGRVAVTVSGRVTQLAAHSDDPHNGDALHPGDAVIAIGRAGGVQDVKRWDGA